MDKVLSWPSIQSDNTTALQEYTLFLRGCCNAVEKVPYMKLDMPANMRTVKDTAIQAKGQMENCSL